MISEFIQEFFLLLYRSFHWHKFKIIVRKDNGADYYICEKCEYIKKI